MPDDHLAGLAAEQGDFGDIEARIVAESLVLMLTVLKDRLICC